MFPKVKKHIDAEELEALGVKMEAAFATAVAKGLEAFFQPSKPARRTGSDGSVAHAR